MLSHLIKDKGGEASLYPNYKKLENLEAKINKFEEEMLTNINSLEKRFSLLKDQVSTITYTVEEERENSKKDQRSKSNNIKEFEDKIKESLIREKEV
jgi:hypothetical protein